MLLDTSQLVTVTREAGALALDRFGSATLEARRKADGSWVTEADTAVEELLIRRLTALEPDLGILAEERASRGITSRERDRVCAIDPIDGTASYVAGVPFWCVSVGLMVGGRPDSGAVFLPPLSKMFATDGRALGLDGRRLELEALRPLDRSSVLLVPSNCHRRFDLTRFLGKTRSYGSTAHHLALLAAGSVSGVLCSGGTRLWDIAAGLALAGVRDCQARHLDGRPLELNAMLDGSPPGSPFLVTHPDHRAELSACIEPRGSDA